MTRNTPIQKLKNILLVLVGFLPVALTQAAEVQRACAEWSVTPFNDGRKVECPRFLLYDHRADPEEQNNLAESSLEIVERLSQQLAKHQDNRKAVK